MRAIRKAAEALVCAAVCASAAPTVEFDIQPRVLRLGEHAVCTITVRGERHPAVPQLPPLDAFQVSGPSTQSSTQIRIVNGQRTHEQSVLFQYRLVPLRAGRFTIGPLAYGKGSDRVSLPPIEVQVVEAPGRAEGSGGSPLIARLQASRNNPYHQEVFHLVLTVLYRDLNLDRSIELLNMPSSGLAVEPFQEMQPGREVVDGQIYETRRFRARARALTAGSMTLAPGLRAQTLTRAAGRRRDPVGFDPPFFDRLFGQVQATPVTLTPTPLVLNIRPLPQEGRPPDFSGAVGRFDFEVRAAPLELQAGEPVTLTLVLSGQGHLDTVTAPDLRLDEDFRVYEPVLSVKETNRKVFEQVVIPRSADVAEIPAVSFSYFDPQEERYRTVQRGPFPLQIAPPDEPVLRADAPPALPASSRLLGEDLVYLKPAPAVITPPGSAALASRPVLLGLLALPALLYAAALVESRRRRSLARDVARARRRQAPRAARHGLRMAEKALRSQDRGLFFEYLADALGAYFGHRLNLPPGEILSNRVLPALREAGLPEDTAGALEEVFLLEEQERFGGGSGADDNACRELLKTLPGLLKACERVRL